MSFRTILTLIYLRPCENALITEEMRARVDFGYGF